MANKFNAKWGIMATGEIAEIFVKDLLNDPTKRGTNDVTHTVTAVASSSSKAKAEKFIKGLNNPTGCAAYGSYEELVKDSNVDIIYVATPHSHHFQNTMLAFEAGKHVLCEKAFTVNAAQAKVLCETAKKKNLFLMEAVWTRFLPVSIQVCESIQRGEIGEVLRVIADASFTEDVENELGTEHRRVKMDLAGGVLLDLGIYSLTWVFQTLYHTLPLSQRKPPSAISCQMTNYHLTGVDEATAILITFPTTTPSNLPNRKSTAVAMTNIRVAPDPDHVVVHPDQRGSSRSLIRIQGTKGEIQVDGPPFRPQRYRVVPRRDDSADPLTIREVSCPLPNNGRGMFWEADETARCVRDGKLESEILPWEESIIIMETMDEARRQGGLVYPERLESTKYPLPL